MIAPEPCRSRAAIGFPSTVMRCAGRHVDGGVRRAHGRSPPRGRPAISVSASRRDAIPARASRLGDAFAFETEFVALPVSSVILDAVWGTLYEPLCCKPASPEQHLSFMSIALEEARAAAALGEVPVGCVIVRDGRSSHSAGNRTLTDHDPTAHARDAGDPRRRARRSARERLTDCDLYVTLEPCAMCAGAISLARIRAAVLRRAPIPKAARSRTACGFSRIAHLPSPSGCLWRDRRSGSRGAAQGFLPRQRSDVPRVQLELAGRIRLRTQRSMPRRRARRHRPGRIARERLVAAVGPDPSALGQRPAIGGPILGDNRFAGGDHQPCDQQELTNPQHVPPLTRFLWSPVPYQQPADGIRQRALPRIISRNPFLMPTEIEEYRMLRSSVRARVGLRRHSPRAIRQRARRSSSPSRA